MKITTTLILACPLLVASGAAFSFNQDIQTLRSDQKQAQINLLRQQDSVVTGYPAVAPEAIWPPLIQHRHQTTDDTGPDRYKSPDGIIIDKNAKPAEPFGPVSIPAPFKPDTLTP